MSEAIEVRVPNIGDFKEVPIIDVLVKTGDAVKAEDPILTLESEKATMDVPAPSAGIVESVAVKVGDKVSEGTPILRLTASNGSTQAPPASAPSAREPRVPAAPAADAPSGGVSAVEVAIPDIGDFKEVPVIDVLVKPGDRIELETPLVVLESEKATMEVPSPAAGIVRSVAVKVGDKVSQGTLVATLESAKAAADTPAPTTLQPTPSAAAPPAPAPSVAAPAAAPTPAGVSVDGALHASPAIRRFARELGVDLRVVVGSGPRGRVTRDDVQSFVKRALQTPAPRTAGGLLDLPPWPKVDFAQFGPVESKPLPRIKKISGPNLARNWVMIPHVTNNDEADITELEAFRRQLNDENPSAKLTVLAFLIKAVVAALQRFPDFNASLDGDNLVYKKYYHIGFAADTPNGLVVPVIKKADTKGVLAIAAETRELAAKARDGKLGLADLQGGTFTISSLGGIGGTSFSPIINAPEVAILGVSRSATRPLWNGREFAPRLMLPLSLSYDHRVIDGAAAARFNSFLAGVLGDIRRLLLG